MDVPVFENNFFAEQNKIIKNSKLTGNQKGQDRRWQISSPIQLTFEINLNRFASISIENIFAALQNKNTFNCLQTANQWKATAFSTLRNIVLFASLAPMLIFMYFLGHSKSCAFLASLNSFFKLLFTAHNFFNTLMQTHTLLHFESYFNTYSLSTSLFFNGLGSEHRIAHFWDCEFDVILVGDKVSCLS